MIAAVRAIFSKLDISQYRSLSKPVCFPWADLWNWVRKVVLVTTSWYFCCNMSYSNVCTYNFWTAHEFWICRVIGLMLHVRCWNQKNYASICQCSTITNSKRIQLPEVSVAIVDAFICKMRTSPLFKCYVLLLMLCKGKQVITRKLTESTKNSFYISFNSALCNAIFICFYHILCKKAHTCLSQ